MPPMPKILVTILTAATLSGLVGCSGGPGHTAQKKSALTVPLPPVTQFVILASRSASFDDRTVVTGGHIGVAPGGGATTPNTLTAGIDTHIGVGEVLLAPQVVLRERATTGEIGTNALNAPRSAVTGPTSAYLAPPAQPTPGTITAGSNTVTVNSGQTVSLAAGAFGAVTVNGTLNLSGGLYQFRSLRINNDARVVARASSIVRVAGVVTGLDRAHLTAGTLAPSALRLIVGGATDALVLGNDVQLTALVDARGDFRAGDRLIFNGSIAGRDVIIGHDCRIGWSGGFGCGSNASCTDNNACTTDSCVDLQCARVALANGTSCSDGNACTRTDGCQAGRAWGRTRWRARPPIRATSRGSAARRRACAPTRRRRMGRPAMTTTPAREPTAAWPASASGATRSSASPPTSATTWGAATRPRRSARIRPKRTGQRATTATSAPRETCARPGYARAPTPTTVASVCSATPTGTGSTTAPTAVSSIRSRARLGSAGVACPKRTPMATGSRTVTTSVPRTRTCSTRGCAGARTTRHRRGRLATTASAAASSPATGRGSAETRAPARRSPAASPSSSRTSTTSSARGRSPGTRPLGACRSIQTGLVQIDSEAEDRFVAQNVVVPASWTAGNDRAVGGDWRWATPASDSGDRFWVGDAGGSRYFARYTAWAAGSPTETGPSSASIDTTAVWTGQSCDTSLGFVCEVPIGHTVDVLMTHPKSACEILGISCPPASFDQCMPAATVFGSLTTDKVNSTIDACFKACPDTEPSTPSDDCLKACQSPFDPPQHGSTCAADTTLGACALASTTSPLHACSTDADCAAPFVCGFFYECRATGSATGNCQAVRRRRRSEPQRPGEGLRHGRRRLPEEQLGRLPAAVQRRRHLRDPESADDARLRPGIEPHLRRLRPGDRLRAARRGGHRPLPRPG